MSLRCCRREQLASPSTLGRWFSAQENHCNKGSSSKPYIAQCRLSTVTVHVHVNRIFKGVVQGCKLIGDSLNGLISAGSVAQPNGRENEGSGLWILHIVEPEI